jgi:hypothetical protein
MSSAGRPTVRRSPYFRLAAMALFIVPIAHWWTHAIINVAHAILGAVR